MALEIEVRTFEANSDKWSDQLGKYVLIKGTDVVDFFVAYEDALKAGYQKFGLTPFLVKQIVLKGTRHFISRSVRPVSTVHS